jgi:putative ABC transport system permease protein
MNQSQQPPRWAERMIERLAPSHLADEIKGDLYEMYLIDLRGGTATSANRNYIRNSLGFLAKQFFWKRQPQRHQHMTGNYFKMAKRSLMASKGTTAINVMGLVIGIASALVILSVIRFEQSFDTFHSNSDNIYRLVRVSGEDLSEHRASIPYPVGDAFRMSIPAFAEVANVEYLGSSTVDVVSADGKSIKQFVEEGGLACVEPNFFDLFDFAGQPLEWRAGDPKTAFNDLHSVVITEAMAMKYFGNEDPLGQTLRFMKKYDFKVTGVIEDFPANTDFPFTFMVSYVSVKSWLRPDQLKDWTSVNDSHNVFVSLQPGAEVRDVELQMAKVHASNVDSDMAKFRHYFLQELKEVHYDARYRNFGGRTITHETILALKVIVIFLLLAGCINYINLATAQSTLRSKEIGLRKVMGSNRGHLVLQFLTETFVVVILATILALLAVLTMMPAVQNILGLKIVVNLLDPVVIGILLAIIVIVTLFSGLYPALMISRFNPIATLRNRFNSDKVAGINLRKILVVAQFTITQVLAVGTFIVVAQMEFFKNVDMGFNRDGVVLNIPIYANDVATTRNLKAELNTLPFVAQTSAAFTLPSGVDRNRSSRNIGKPDAQEIKDYQNYEYNSIDEEFLDLYGIKMIAGRTLTDADTTGQLLINMMLVTKLEFKSAEEAVGAKLKIGGDKKVTVVGVINDYYSNSLKEDPDQVAIEYDPHRYRKLSVKLDLNEDQSMTTALSEIEKVWLKHYPDWAFQYVFFDDNIELFYKQESKYSNLFQIFSTIFILIGCLGLYGLITFIANKKGKEIAIRKTLGASIADIIVMFSREYVALIGISFTIAVPVAWYGTSEWLSNFANHIPLEWWLFAAPGLIVLLIALLVVTSKSFNAARANPVEKLKAE